MSLVSVIMPIYNTEEYLEQSIQSVLNQTYKKIELILIDDGSNDQSKYIIEKYRGKSGKIKVYHNENNMGVGYTRNYGLMVATGDFIYFIDSDDYLSENTIQLLIENIYDDDAILGNIEKTHLSDKSNQIIHDEYEKEYINNLFVNKNIQSVIHCLFNKNFIMSNHLTFNERVVYYSELEFLVEFIANNGRISYLNSSYYFKRKRNDPISNPSLLQIDMHEIIGEFTQSYLTLKESFTEISTNKYLEHLLINLYVKRLRTYFTKNNISKTIFNNISQMVNQINNLNTNNFSYLIRKELKILNQGSYEQFKRVYLRHIKLRKIKNAFKGRIKLYTQLYHTIFLKLPRNEKLVVFESFLGKSYSDSPKYIYEYMIKNNLNYNYVWIINERKSIPGSAVQVKRFSLRYFYYLARAKYWIFNSRIPKTLDKPKGNIYLQTWHGTPLKTLVFDMKDIHSANPNYKMDFYYQSRRWDYLSSPNKYSSDIFKRAFKYEKEVLEYGYPRNDILHNKNKKEDINKLKVKLNIPKNKKVILYAPTWRDDEFYSAGKYKFSIKLDLDKMQEKLGEEYVILLRMHYFIASQLDVTDYESFVYDFSDYDDIAELYLISDILITDYSSVFFDYANLKRPILFYTYDLEKYRDKLRGFYLDMEKEVPGPLLMNSEEVIRAISNIQDVSEEYKVKYNKFYNRFCQWDDGNATKNTVKRILKNNF